MGTATHNHGNLARVQIQSAYTGALNRGKGWSGISSETCHFLCCLQQSALEERRGKREEKVSLLIKFLRNHRGMLLEEMAENMIRRRKKHQTENGPEGKGRGNRSAGITEMKSK